MMKTRKTFRMGVVGLIAAVSLVVGGCLDDDTNNNIVNIPVSYVSLYNASPNAPALNIVVDDRLINRNAPLRYADYTGYLRFHTGERTLEVGPYGANNVTLDTAITLVDNRAYSIFVVDNYENAELLVLNDSSAAEPATGKAMIRFVNLSPDAAPLTLKVKDAAVNLTDAQSFKGATPFQEVDAQSYNFEVVAGVESVLNIPNVSLPAGAYKTVLVRGYKTPPAGNTSVLSGEVIVH
jgi:hypothetical protein